ncbi:hypothetical protein ES705_19368 [subsurface metagenome]
MRKSNSIEIPGLTLPAGCGWKIKRDRLTKNPKEIKLIAFRIPVKMVDKIDKFADKLELKYLPIKGKGIMSLAIRLLIEDSLNRYMGPKNEPDELVCPFADEMSEILPVLKNIRLREKLDEMPDNTSHNKEEIDKIIKKYG